MTLCDKAHNAEYDFMFMFNSKFNAILYRFQDTV